MLRKIPSSEPRTLERIREHYEIEKELASRLRAASKENRAQLYSSLYDELFRQVLDHPQLANKLDKTTRERRVRKELAAIRRFLERDSVFMEVGAGDCSLSIVASQFTRHVFAVEVSSEIAKSVTLPHNVEFVLSDGRSIPVEPDSVDVAYSNQLMEHLHPDDAVEQLVSVWNALKRGGVYICITPNRLNGPHDISAYFDEVATGFHLKEYTARELSGLFKSAGFSKTRLLMAAGELSLLVPALPIFLVEQALARLPRPVERRTTHWRPVRLLLGVKMVGTK